MRAASRAKAARSERYESRNDARTRSAQRLAERCVGAVGLKQARGGRALDAGLFEHGGRKIDAGQRTRPEALKFLEPSSRAASEIDDVFACEVAELSGQAALFESQEGIDCGVIVLGPELVGALRVERYRLRRVDG